MRAYGNAVMTAPPPSGDYLAPMELPKTIVRIGEQALWSTQQYADAAAVANTTDRVFTVNRGATGQGFGAALSLPETNMKEASRIAGGLAYDVFAVACQMYRVTCSFLARCDLDNLLQNAVLQWDFLNTRVEIAHVSLIGQGGGVFGATADTGAADGGLGGSREFMNNGNGQLWVYRLHPVILPSNTTFAVEIVWGNAAIVINEGAVNVRISLLGRYQTAIPLG